MTNCFVFIRPSQKLRACDDSVLVPTCAYVCSYMCLCVCVYVCVCVNLCVRKFSLCDAAWVPPVGTAEGRCPFFPAGVCHVYSRINNTCRLADLSLVVTVSHCSNSDSNNNNALND